MPLLSEFWGAQRPILQWNRCGEHTRCRMKMSSLPITKNDACRLLIELGYARGYAVIPEFRVAVPTPTTGLPLSEQKATKRQSLDIAWVKRLPKTTPLQQDVWQKHWALHAAIEIEAYDVQPSSFAKHLAQLPRIATASGVIGTRFIALYSQAFDRSSLSRKNLSGKIAKLRSAAAPVGITVFLVGTPGWQTVLPP